MSAITFDTYKIIKHLQEKGFSREQAEGLVEALQEVDVSQLATKRDLLELRYDLLKWLVPLLLGLYGLIIVKIGV